jgi:hypothetical protein
MEIVSYATDFRTSTPVIYARVPISEYLGLIGDNFEDFAIQRRREKHKAYDRMKSDLAGGALLPTIALAVRPEVVPSIVSLIDDRSEAGRDLLRTALSAPGQANILDGLQRTYVLRDLQQEGVTFHPEQSLMIEFWLEANISHLVYRIIVLNAGQKPMSMRHQVELLFSTIKHKIQERIPNLEIYSERDQTRRRRPRKYALDRLALAYKCYLTQTPEIQRENVVAQQLLEADILDSDEEEIYRRFDMFLTYLEIYANIDEQVCRVYETENNDLGIPTGANWFGSENVINAFFAAISQYASNPDREARLNIALNALITKTSTAEINSDPLDLAQLQRVVSGLPIRKVNIGYATRKLLTNGFKEYFRDDGETSFADCWTRASE